MFSWCTFRIRSRYQLRSRSVCTRFGVYPHARRYVSVVREGKEVGCPHDPWGEGVVRGATALTPVPVMMMISAPGGAVNES